MMFNPVSVAGTKMDKSKVQIFAAACIDGARWATFRSVEGGYNVNGSSFIEVLKTEMLPFGSTGSYNVPGVPITILDYL